MASHLGREIATISEAAHHAQVSTRTIYYWLETNRIEAVLTPGGRTRIYLDSLFRPRPTTESTPEPDAAA